MSRISRFSVTAEVDEATRFGWFVRSIRSGVEGRAIKGSQPIPCQICEPLQEASRCTRPAKAGNAAAMLPTSVEDPALRGFRDQSFLKKFGSAVK